MKSKTYALFKKIPWFVMSFFVFCYNNIYASYQNLSFDTLFPVTLYKDVLDESMDICGDLQLLSENTTHHQTLLDCMIGRMVRLAGRIETLCAYQEATHTHLPEDGAYLLSVLEEGHMVYQSCTQAARYQVLIPLFVEMRSKLIHAFLL